MKTVLVLASLAASAFAQAIHILQPTSGAAIKAGSPFTLEIQQEGSLQRISQGTVTVSAGGQVIYSGPFNPLFHSAAPAKGMYQDYYLTMPNVPHAGKGLVVLDVQHDFSVPNAANQPQPAHNSASTIVRIV